VSPSSPSSTPALLELENLHVAVDGAEILKGIDLVVPTGEVHALMGPNGSGKSTLANTLLGNPNYTVTSGSIRFKGDDITDWAPDARAKVGMFLAFQYPEEIAGVSVMQFLRQAISARVGEDRSVLEVRMSMLDWMGKLKMDPSFAERHLNEGFSGGEKKRNEILQMALLQPEIAVLDETDSGLDIDALRIVSEGVQAVRAERPSLGVLLVTHYTRILKLLRPDVVHVLVDGKIVGTGGSELADRLESDGFESWRS
jgi:Fe-S cluster assembly ATP-binding protein